MTEQGSVGQKSGQPTPLEAGRVDLRAEYLSALTSLATRGIENPTDADLARVTPHLNTDQRKEVFVAGENGIAYIACPPTLVRRGYNVISYNLEPYMLSDGRIIPPTLRFASSARTLDSYADSRPHGDVLVDEPYQEEAMKYAEEHWGDKLVVDNWSYFTTMYVQDPTDLYPDGTGWSAGTPKTKFTVYYTSYRDCTDMAKDHSKPQSEIVNDALAIATLNKVEGSELKGGRDGWTEFMCAHCAGGLGLSSCTNCGNQFRGDHIRSGHVEPISPKVEPISPKIVALIEGTGYKFTMDPSIAYERETQRWEGRSGKTS
mgnify:CR=1 FL=1